MILPIREISTDFFWLSCDHIDQAEILMTKLKLLLADWLTNTAT